ncbi:uncharacterized protein DNG_02176 [Cephalotrichum gorgonifer]|uniref:Uncharacterized protein n=1 Tax=Cephalotrichum gorgonifer TaxID=2041049 RepID=A0AAE8MT51_9PEZI|nr:uncharacterized protein DNG_02176 [Cephalotrichum gorgonifer]
MNANNYEQDFQSWQRRIQETWGAWLYLAIFKEIRSQMEDRSTEAERSEDRYITHMLKRVRPSLDNAIARLANRLTSGYTGVLVPLRDLSTGQPIANFPLLAKDIDDMCDDCMAAILAALEEPVDVSYEEGIARIHYLAGTVGYSG